jgi:hypothetical protein
MHQRYLESVPNGAGIPSSKATSIIRRQPEMSDGERLRPQGDSDRDRPVPDADVVPWPQYAAAIVELVLDGDHVVLTPTAARTGDGDAASPLASYGDLIWVLTAGDPFPVTLAAEDNAARERQLCAELDLAGIRHDPALGRSPDGASSEVSRALRGIDRATALDIARRHGQLAVYEIADEIRCVDVATSTVVTRRGYLLEIAPADGRLAGPTGWCG